ncbi:MAG: ASKHA domain-containing protein [Oscillospiraceae bacterium]
MLEQYRYFYEKYRGERSAELAAAFDITPCGISVVYYDIALSARYARAVLACERVTADKVLGQLTRLLSVSMQRFGIPARAIKSVGAAAGTHITALLESALDPVELRLAPETEIYVLPYISAAIGGRFTASLLTLPEGGFAAADIGESVCIAVKSGGGLKCAAFPLAGAFDCSALTFGMPAENGAILSVYSGEEGLCYSVCGDIDAAGIAPCAAAEAAVLMLDRGTLDSFGILTDRDKFTIGEELFLTQEDIRVLQTDKARCAAALELMLGEAEPSARTFLSGEPFAEGGLKALLKLGAVPGEYAGAAFCRNSVEQGVINYIVGGKYRSAAQELVMSAQDITERLLPEFDELYIKNLEFGENL